MVNLLHCCTRSEHAQTNNYYESRRVHLFASARSGSQNLLLSRQIRFLCRIINHTLSENSIADHIIQHCKLVNAWQWTNVCSFLFTWCASCFTNLMQINFTKKRVINTACLTFSAIHTRQSHLFRVGTCSIACCLRIFIWFPCSPCSAKTFCFLWCVLCYAVHTLHII